MDANGRPETIAELVAIADSMEHNVISTGAGNLPTQLPNAMVENYFQTAIDATMSRVHDPMMALDRELLSTVSPRLTSLGRAVKTGKEKARFKVAATPKTKLTTEELHERATTITIGTTIIHPVEEGVAR